MAAHLPLHPTSPEVSPHRCPRGAGRFPNQVVTTVSQLSYRTPRVCSFIAPTRSPKMRSQPMSRRPKFVFTLALLFVALLTLRGSVLTVPSGTWQPTGNLSVARAGASAAQLQNGSVLITGGESGSGPVASADIFNTDGSISTVAPMNNLRANHVSVVLQDGRVLVAGGSTTSGGVTNSAEIYDAIANTWTSIPGGMTAARAGATAALLNDRHVFLA